MILEVKNSTRKRRYDYNTNGKLNHYAYIRAQDRSLALARSELFIIYFGSGLVSVGNAATLPSIFEGSPCMFRGPPKK
jgi:hypothetical protein